MKKLLVLALFICSAALAQTEVRWFVGLGAGSDQALWEAQEDIVADFNASQDDIELVLDIVDADLAVETLATQIAAGNQPDIVGPMGIKGRAAFDGAWLDLSDLIEENSYDLTDFDPALVDFYRVRGQGQLGIPFAVFPSFLAYNKDLFDELDLPYPPSAYGEPYINADGEEQEWTLETVEELAKQLTFDAEGNDATMEEFDANSTEQWGYGVVYTDLRGVLTQFGPGNFVDADGNAVMPENWRAGLQEYQDAMWVDGYTPNAPYSESTLLSGDGNLLGSGNVAMVNAHLWYVACCIGELDAVWDAAPVPSYNGEPTAKLHADTFSILEGSSNPEAAFQTLSYLLSPEISGELSNIYGGMPARLSLQDEYFANFAENFEGEINWDVVAAGLSYPDNPNHEEYLPSYSESVARYSQFSDELTNNADFDIDAEVESLLSDLQAIYDASGD